MALTDAQVAEIAAHREAFSLTRRATVPDLEEMLFSAMPLLDHGFLRVIDYMGDDSAVVRSARVSYGRGTRKVSEDAGLIRYLMRHRHSTPFESCEIAFHVKLPIFVARQWIRHRMANVNEYSARYSVLDREFYIPAQEHLAAQSQDNRQGRGEVLEEQEAEEVLRILREDADRTYSHYEYMVNEGGADPSRKGVARELARMNLTLNTYTQMYWKTDLHNLLNFLSLRADGHAQYEIRVYAECMMKVVQTWVPKTFEAFRDYRFGAVSLSAPMLKVVRSIVRGEQPTQQGSGLSSREWGELQQLLNAPDPAAI